MPSKYVDTAAIIQVIGSVYKNTSLLDSTEKYFFSEEDFPDKFHKIIFGSIYKIHELGAQKVTIENITDYLSSRPKLKAIYDSHDGNEFLQQVTEAAQPLSFDYYYNRLKKMTLLRAYDSIGLDVSKYYDPDNIFEPDKKQKQEEWLDNTPLEKIAESIENDIEQIKLKYAYDSDEEASQAGKGIKELIESLKQTPEIGIPMYGPLINTVTRGARLKKFYLRSGYTGGGKSRMMVADACYFGCDEIYDSAKGKWIKDGSYQSTLYITTEQELSEIQTMMLAFLADVPEDHILDGQYLGDEEVRINYAAEVLKRSKIYVEELPDFSLQDVENTIKKNIREHNVLYVCHDYLHTSIKILEEISQRSGGIKLREDNVLFMLSTKLKDICNKEGIFLISATQLNGTYQDAKTPDQNLLRGAKAIADKIDTGLLILPVKEEDQTALLPITKTNLFSKPNMKLSIYKNRRGKYKGIYLWCDANLSTCRVKPLFATTWNYELIEMDDTHITVEQESAF